MGCALRSFPCVPSSICVTYPQKDGEKAGIEQGYEGNKASEGEVEDEREGNIRKTCETTKGAKTTRESILGSFACVPSSMYVPTLCTPGLPAATWRSRRARGGPNGGKVCRGASRASRRARTCRRSARQAYPQTDKRNALCKGMRGARTARGTRGRRWPATPANSTTDDGKREGSWSCSVQIINASCAYNVPN